ncbi:MAG: enoyl-CoA hydratase/isomerase family protein [Rhodobacteraceae bacterium]|nr:enoyl-CoA hydratase/isomerase family protein [Paracoccaceae bacterium]
MTEVLLETDGDIAVLTLNRPDKRNALTDGMVDAVLGTLRQVAASPARALVVTGAGKGFCAGFDLSLAADARDDAAFWVARQERYAALVTALRALPQPTIAAVNGAAAGAGFGLALACDTRIGSTACRFNAAFIKVGMSSCDIGVSWLLPRAIGTTRAFELMLTGRMAEADEAERIGLVLRLTPPESLLYEARGLARQIAANGQLGTWLTKRGMWANLEAGSLAAALELENRTQILMRGTGSLAAEAQGQGFSRR